MTDTKTCTKCGVCKPVGEFSPDPKGKDGSSARCKACAAVAAAAWHAANPEQSRASKAAYRAANKEKTKAMDAAYRAANPEKVRAGRAAKGARASADLSDRYIKERLAQKTGLPPSAFNFPVLIDLKREQLTLHRLARELKQHLTQPKGNRNV